MATIQNGPSERTGLLNDNAPQDNGYNSTTHAGDEVEDQSTDQPDEGEAPQRLILIFAGLAFPIFLGTFDRYLVNTNYVQIATEFDALGIASWISTSFFLAVACAQPLWGRLSDIFGRKPCLLVAYSLFAIGNLGCGLAPSMGLFIGSRVIQGLGAGGASILTTITLNDLVPDRDRGTWQGYLNLFASIGSSLGAPLGGLFADQIGWRWAFYMQVPLIGISLINSTIFLRLPRTERPRWQDQLRRIDFLGAIFLAGSIFCLLFGIDRGSQGSFQDPISFVPLAVCPVALALLLLNESRLEGDGFIPPWSSMNQSVWSVYAVNLFSYGAFSSIQFWVPLFYQAFDDVGPTQTGIRLLPATFAIVAGNLIGGRILKQTGYYRGLVVFGQLAAACGMAIIILGTIFTDNDILIISIGLFCACFFFGMALSGTLLALICNIDRTQQGVLTACMFTLRSLGSASAISLSGTAIQTYFRDTLHARLPHGADTDEIVRRVAEDLRAIKDLNPSLQRLVRDSYGESIRLGFGLLTALFILAFFASLGIKSGRIPK